MSELTPANVDRAGGEHPVPPVAWFCLRSQPKHEHIAAGHLRQMEGVEVFNPRIRFKRSTRLGPALVTEAMFPNYLFARFNWRESLTRVHYAPGISCVVHFGTKWPTVPDQAIDEIRAVLSAEGIHVVGSEPEVGGAKHLARAACHADEGSILSPQNESLWREKMLRGLSMTDD